MEVDEDAELIPELTEEEIRELNSEAYAELYAARLAAQYDDVDLVDLTDEQVERAVDP
jgi:hypothetical protein